MVVSREKLLHLTYTAACATWPWTGLSTVIFGMRSYSRSKIPKEALGWDDLIITFSWLLNIVRAVSFQICLSTAKHATVADLPGTYPTPIFWALFTDAWAFISVCIPKLGVAILLCRMLRPRRWLKVTMITYCLILTVLAIVGVLITFFQCDPAPGQWNPWKYPNTKCWYRNIQLDYAIVVSALSALTDLAFSVYPGIVVWRLNMPKWKRVNVIALLGLGFLSFAFAIKKLVSNTLLYGNPEVTTLLYHAIEIGIWNSIENDFVLSAACLPAVPPFFRAFKKGWKTHVSTSRSRSSYIKSNSGSIPLGRKDEEGGTELMDHHTMHISHPEGSKVSKVGSERRPSEFI